MDADVAVIGGGPAGAIVATLLARRGHDVLVLERSTAYRWRACGVFSSPATGGGPAPDRHGCSRPGGDDAAHPRDARRDDGRIRVSPALRHGRAGRLRSRRARHGSARECCRGRRTRLSRDPGRAGRAGAGRRAADRWRAGRPGGGSGAIRRRDGRWALPRRPCSRGHAASASRTASRPHVSRC